MHRYNLIFLRFRGRGGKLNFRGGGKPQGSHFLNETLHFISLLPARASEQGNVIGSVRIYVQKKIVIERTRDLIYLKFVATDFFLKIISPSAGENSGEPAVALAILQFMPC